MKNLETAVGSEPKSQIVVENCDFPVKEIRLRRWRKKSLLGLPGVK